MEEKPLYTAAGKQAASHYKQYVRNAVETATPLMLIIMLYDEAIKMCALAIDDMGINKESVHNKLIK
ncbi:MAG TPA: flagellar protein FliS, partial [bacterium]|nr:flagellar protein FliS [bacterium]